MACGEDEEVQPRVVLRGGSSLVSCKPLFSNDSKYLLVASGFVVKVLGVKSGECVRQLKGHKAKVTSIGLHPHNPYQLFSCSQDQTLIKWDFTDGALLKRYKCPNRLHYIKPTNLENPEFVGLAQTTAQQCELVQFSLPAKKKTVVQFTTLGDRLTMDGRIALGCKDDVLACVDNKRLIVRSFMTQTGKVHSYCPGDSDTLKVVACHPLEYCIATGSRKGVISLWYNFLSDKPVRNNLKWHALTVRALAFTTEGSYLLSGGHECVLVKWEHSTAVRDTLPRLGAPIVHITNSLDNMYSATSHSDNSIQLTSSQFKTTQVFMGLTQAGVDRSGKEDHVPVGLLLDPRTSSLVLNGRPGHLQFYDLYKDRQLYSVDIVCQNYISPENLNRPLEMTTVIKADFSPGCDWLATVEWRDDGKTAVEQRLKFWFYDTKQQTYTLNTSVELPHVKSVQVVKFRPMPSLDDTSYAKAPTVVTSSHDGNFKIWTVTDDSDIYRSRACWSCEFIGYYSNLPTGDLDFSEDGSLLGVAFTSTLTLWDPDTNALRHIFPLEEPIRKVVFGCGISSHLVLATTKSHVCAFNLLTCSLAWSRKLKVNVICKHVQTGYVAMFTKSNDLIVIDMLTSDTVYEKLNISSASVLSAIFVPNVCKSNLSTRLPWQAESQLYFLTADQELLTLTEEVEEMIEAQVIVSERLPETPFSLLIAEQRRRKETIVPGHYTGSHGMPGTKFLNEMLNTPAHVLPPVSTLCASFMERLMITKTQSRQDGVTEEVDEKEDEPSDAEVESDSDNDSDSKMDFDVTPALAAMDVRDNKPVVKCKDFSGVSNDMFSWTNTL